MAWIGLREPILHLITTPALLLPLLAGLVLLLSATVGLGWAWRALVSGLAVALLSLLYSPLSTAALSAWLTSQLPAPSPSPTGSALAVLVGRGPEIAAATTTLAARMVRDGHVERIYVSGDSSATAERLLQLGVSPARIAGDSCARTTWENATITNAWIRDHTSRTAPTPPLLLITDPWQLPRASRAFQRQQLSVTPVAVDPRLPPRQQNRLALRETAATLLYAFQGRM
ncbi:MAG: YdcF family protein [Cyanobacteria bacterium]|nr:YdcF family protein [Synechococcus sp. CS-205]NQV10123.1 YdcF family protein [Cyanobacteria bacterium bin.51]